MIECETNRSIIGKYNDRRTLAIPPRALRALPMIWCTTGALRIISISLGKFIIISLSGSMVHFPYGKKVFYHHPNCDDLKQVLIRRIRRDHTKSWSLSMRLPLKASWHSFCSIRSLTSEWCAARDNLQNSRVCIFSLYIYCSSDHGLFPKLVTLKMISLFVEL
jgi:hypothetical protein